MKIKEIIILKLDSNISLFDLNIVSNKLYFNVNTRELFLRYKIKRQIRNIKNIDKNQIFLFDINNSANTNLINVDKNMRFLNILNRANIVILKIERAIFNKDTLIRSKVL